MSRKKKVTDENLDRLSASINELLRLTTIDLNDLRGGLFHLQNEVEALTANLEEVREVEAIVKGTSGGANVNIDWTFVDDDIAGPAEPQYDDAETEKAPRPYELIDSTELYVSGDGDAYDTAIELLQEARAANQDPTNLLVGVQYVPAGADGEPSYFAGHVAVSV